MKDIRPIGSQDFNTSGLLSGDTRFKGEAVNAFPSAKIQVPSVETIAVQGQRAEHIFT